MKDRAQPADPTEPDAGAPAPRTAAPGALAPGTQTPGTQAFGTQASGTHAPDEPPPEAHAPGEPGASTQTAGTQTPHAQPPGTPTTNEPPGDSPPTAPDLARLFQEHNASLVQLLRARLRSDQEAWDVAQEAYVRMLQLDRVGTISYLRAYLFRTAFNIATDRLRSGTVRAACHRDPMFDPGVDERSPDRSTIAAEALRAVSGALQTLPPKARRAFVLYRFDELETVEIARRMGVSDRMVRYYIQQAMAACHAALEDRQA